MSFQMLITRIFAFGTLSLLVHSVAFAQVTTQRSSNRDAQSSSGRWATMTASQSRSTRAQFQLNETEMAKVVRPITQRIVPSVASIEKRKRRVALGVVISPDGQILTKLSSLQDEIEVEVNGKRYDDVKVLGIHKKSDLVLLKIDAQDLQPVEFFKSPPALGSWLVSPTLDDIDARLGICSAEVAKGDPRGFLGVNLKMAATENNASKVEISGVVKNSPADIGGLRVNDAIIAVAEKPVETIAKLQLAMSKFAIGEVIEISMIRDGNKISKFVELAERSSITGSRAASGNRKVRSQFPVAFGHDAKLSRQPDCGGPVVNLSGQVLGINVLSQHRGVDLYSPMPEEPAPTPYLTMARSNICLAIPGKYVQSILGPLADGRLSPLVVNRDLIQSLDQELLDTMEQLQNLGAKSDQPGHESKASDRRTRITLTRKLRQLEDKRVKLRRGF